MKKKMQDIILTPEPVSKFIVMQRFVWSDFTINGVPSGSPDGSSGFLVLFDTEEQAQAAYPGYPTCELSITPKDDGG
jgi:hypothetical protein